MSQLPDKDSKREVTSASIRRLPSRDQPTSMIPMPSSPTVAGAASSTVRQRRRSSAASSSSASTVGAAGIHSSSSGSGSSGRSRSTTMVAIKSSRRSSGQADAVITAPLQDGGSLATTSRQRREPCETLGRPAAVSESIATDLEGPGLQGYGSTTLAAAADACDLQDQANSSAVASAGFASAAPAAASLLVDPTSTSDVSFNSMSEDSSGRRVSREGIEEGQRSERTDSSYHGSAVSQEEEQPGKSSSSSPVSTGHAVPRWKESHHSAAGIENASHELFERSLSMGQTHQQYAGSRAEAQRVRSNSSASTSTAFPRGGSPTSVKLATSASSPFDARSYRHASTATPQAPLLPFQSLLQHQKEREGLLGLTPAEQEDEAEASLASHLEHSSGPRHRRSSTSTSNSDSSERSARPPEGGRRRRRESGSSGTITGSVPNRLRRQSLAGPTLRQIPKPGLSSDDEQVFVVEQLPRRRTSRGASDQSALFTGSGDAAADEKGRAPLRSSQGQRAPSRRGSHSSSTTGASSGRGRAQSNSSGSTGSTRLPVTAENPILRRNSNSSVESATNRRIRAFYFPPSPDPAAITPDATSDDPVGHLSRGSDVQEIAAGLNTAATPLTLSPQEISPYRLPRLSQSETALLDGEDLQAPGGKGLHQPAFGGVQQPHTDVRAALLASSEIDRASAASGHTAVKSSPRQHHLFPTASSGGAPSRPHIHHLSLPSNVLAGSLSAPVSAITNTSSRLPLTPLEEVNSPMMSLDSPADLAEAHNPFNDPRALSDALAAISGSTPYHSTSTGDLRSNLSSVTVTSQQGDESFYHALLEIVTSEDGYTDDLTDLVEVHFSLLSFARFVTDEQRDIIVRDATNILNIHRRVQAKLRRVDEDLGWIRDHQESNYLSSPSTVTSFDEHPIAPYQPAASTSSTSSIGSGSTATATKRFKSSDATVADAARRISAIYLNEAQNLSEAYKPFCSGHPEAMDVVKYLSSHRLDWDSFEAQCTTQLALRKSSSTRLHFADFLIKPVQRICRYPLLFAALWKNAPVDRPTATGQSTGSPRLPRIYEALTELKRVAAEVDEAQRTRNLEIATVKLARRMDVHVPEHTQLLNHLDQVILVGSAHVIYTNATLPTSVGHPSTVKAAFYGLVLYRTHLLFIKPRKTNLYEPKHWLPLRLFDMHKVPDGEGMLPYAFRMTYREHIFEVGSLCHQEQDIWVSTLDATTNTCRERWTQASTEQSANPASLEETLVCSESVDPAVASQTASPILPSVELGHTFSYTPASPDPSHHSTSASVSFSADQRYNTPYHHDPAALRPRLSLKPPAQRVSVDLRLADLLTDAILTARAQSKRSHAMPLHGPPPRALTTPGVAPAPASYRRPQSFTPGTFSYKSILDRAPSSRRSSIGESSDAGSGTSTGVAKPPLKHMFSTASSSGYSTASGATYQPGQGNASAPMPAGAAVRVAAHSGPVALPAQQQRKPTKLLRSRTSTSGSDNIITKPVRSGTLSRIRRRAASLYQEQVPQAVLDDLRQQARGQEEQHQVVAPVPQPQIVERSEASVVAEDAAVTTAAATVARNSSTSSSSSAGSGSTNPSNLSHSVGTPQSSLPASPLLTPVDLEGHSRWSKLGDAITHSLSRKRSFASSRPILAVPPEPALDRVQLQQAQHAAEYIYTGSGSAGSSCASSQTGNSESYGMSGHRRSTTSAPANAHERRYSWDKFGWGSSRGGALSGGGTSANNSSSNLAAGRSAPSLHLSVDHRQSSSSSLWSVFNANHGDSMTSSPTPSIYESAHEEDDTRYSPNSGLSNSPQEVTPTSSPPLASGATNPHARAFSLASLGSPAFSTSDSSRPSLSRRASPHRQLSGGLPPSSFTRVSPPPAAASPSSVQSAPGAQLPGAKLGPSKLKRNNSISARLRAFKSLGSTMTPLPSSSNDSGR